MLLTWKTNPKSNADNNKKKLDLYIGPKWKAANSLPQIS